MGKKFDVIMAGVISGIVTITTTFLGLAGTVIGTVLGSIIYQYLSTYVKESFDQSSGDGKLKINNLQLFEDKIVFIIPLILIIAIEVSFVSSIVYNNSTFNDLENLTNNNLFRSIGIGLFIIGLYSILQPKKIKYQYGLTLFGLSVFFLARGFVDTMMLYIPKLTYSLMDFLLVHDLEIALLIILILCYITIKLFYDSLKIYLDENSRGNDLKDYNNDNRSMNRIGNSYNGTLEYNDVNTPTKNKKNKFIKNDSNKNMNGDKSNKKAKNYPKTTNIYYSKKDNSVNISKDEKALIASIGKHSKIK
ncbi:MAG: hypothetical protein LBC39_05975 [Methanobrevibacter sp.]|jgi:hypothetical protein|nr:hypothetical protein [Candidatus Methanovirga aequatorialis]